MFIYGHRKDQPVSTMSKARAFRERIDMPTATLVALAGMLVTVAVVAIRFIQIGAYSLVESPLGIRIAVTVAATIMFAAVPIAAALSVRHGWRFAPHLVTFVGAAGALLILGFADLLGLVAGVAGIAAAIAVWMPSALKYGARLRALGSP